MFLISSLNDMQQKIVKDTQGAILVTAGAGSGKTRLLTHRICNIISSKLANAENVLAITFTNKATNEMKERIASMIPNARHVWISTFHAMCVRILRSSIENLGSYNKFFTIYDESDKDRLIKSIIKTLNIDNTDFKNKLTWHIANAKNNGFLPTSYEEELKYEPFKLEILKGYKMYEKTMRENNALDFDDLLVKTVELFEKVPAVLDYYQTKFKYIHVDEFQDTNLVQYKLLKLLSAKHKNIFVVGDEDQCIYCWRGANIENIANFIKDFDCKVYKLEQNYRSTKNIIESANKLIKQNKERIDKTLFTDNEKGEEVTFFKAYDENAEAEYVAKTIIDLTKKGVPSSEIGVLMRISSLSRLVEEKLLNYDIPYKVSGIFKFFERQEIKNVLAYLSVIINPRDTVSLFRIINTPKRGIGNVTLQKLSEIASEKNTTVFDVILNIRDYDLSAGVMAKVLTVSNLLKDLLIKKDQLGLSDFIIELLKTSGLADMYNKSADDDEDRRRNLDQLILSAKSFENLTEGGIAEYLESVTLQTSIDESDEENAVSISTVHASKGLEFDYVFIIGMEENCFPLARKMEIEDIEEERRLAYVAITRARKKVYLTRASSRYLYGNRNMTLQSRFINEIGLEAEEDNNYTNYHTSSFAAPSDFLINTNKNYNQPRVNNFTVSDFNQSKIKETNKYTGFDKDAKVLHPTFGNGVIISKENIGEVTFVKVDFGGFGVKNLSLAFAPLELVD